METSRESREQLRFQQPQTFPSKVRTVKLPSTFIVPLRASLTFCLPVFMISRSLGCGPLQYCFLPSPRFIITRLQRRYGYYSSRWATVATTTTLLLLQQPPGRAMSTSTTTTTIKSKSRIAVAQLCSTSCKLDNLLNVATCAGWASHSGDCSMLFLPECFGFIGTSAEHTLAAAEPLPSSEENAKRNLDRVTQVLIQRVQGSALTGVPSNPPALAPDNESESTALQELSLTEEDDRNISLLDGLRTIARASNMWISGGGMHVAVPGEPRVYNTHVIVDNDGMLRSQYRKMHLFDVCIPGKVDLRESKTTKAGEELVLCDSPSGKSFYCFC